ncbi:hypothetical protein BFW01_g6639 [Lasiodiplodia theobromae]|nr:hypothetical protein BFW01_g6639 [Lasiodiplodia theobromae]
MPFWNRRHRCMRNLKRDVAIAAEADPALLEPYQTMLSSEFGASIRTNGIARSDPRPVPARNSRSSSVRDAEHTDELDDDIERRLSIMAGRMRSTRASSDADRETAGALRSATVNGRVGAARTLPTVASPPECLDRAGNPAHAPQTSTAHRFVEQQADETTMAAGFGTTASVAGRRISPSTTSTSALTRRSSGSTSDLTRFAALEPPSIDEHTRTEDIDHSSETSSVSSDEGVWIAGQAPRSHDERVRLRAAVLDMEDRFDNPNRGPEFTVIGDTIGTAQRVWIADL